MRWKIAGVGGAAVAAVLVTLALATLASAHAKVTQVEWDNTTNPTKVTATAVEEIANVAGTYSLKVYNSNNVEVDKGDTTIDPNDATKMSVSVNANLPVGIYRVDWATVSADDGDAASDSLDLPLGVTITPSPTPPPHNHSVTVTLSALNGSGVSGTATVTEADDGDTQVTVTLSGLQPGTTHMEHVHMGATCSSQASELGMHLFDLDDITADTSGNATSESEGDVAFLDAADGTHKIVVHAGPDASTDANKVPISCGTIPSALIASASPTHTPASVPSTGGAPAGSSAPWLMIVLAGAFLVALSGVSLTMARQKR
jgi:methionine-rich copper-binding protein CopC/Cu/Zn superoxide dismutase